MERLSKAVGLALPTTCICGQYPPYKIIHCLQMMDGLLYLNKMIKHKEFTIALATKPLSHFAVEQFQQSKHQFFPL
jgi:hypothetical protein